MRARAMAAPEKDHEADHGVEEPHVGLEGLEEILVGLHCGHVVESGEPLAHGLLVHAGPVADERGGGRLDQGGGGGEAVDGEVGEGSDGFVEEPGQAFGEHDGCGAAGVDDDPDGVADVDAELIPQGDAGQDGGGPTPCPPPVEPSVLDPGMALQTTAPALFDAVSRCLARLGQPDPQGNSALLRRPQATA
jgi:hypothetical protein